MTYFLNLPRDIIEYIRFDGELLLLTFLCVFIRERALGGSRRRVKQSWQGALLMPPASRLTELLTRKSVILQDRSSLPSFVGNQDYLPMGRTFGRVSPRSENLALLP